MNLSTYSLSNEEYDDLKILIPLKQLKEMAQLVCDPENQPHQFMGVPDVLLSRFLRDRPLISNEREINFREYLESLFLWRKCE